MRRTGLTIALILVAAAARANTYTVTTTADSGAGSLRQAITDANGNGGPDTIAFNIAGSGVHTITLASALPPLTSPVTIDGYTQSGASSNTLPFGQGLNTVVRIQVTGGAGVGTCFAVQASDTTIKGLVVNGCTTSVDIQSGSNNRVEGNFLGTDPTGTQRLVDSGIEVVVGAAPSAHVGGSSPAARNLITACGVAVHATGANSGADIQGNVIGIAASGDVLLTPPCASTTFPIVIDGPNGQAVRNVIAGGANGIFLQGSSGKVARGNYVGTDATGTVVLGLSQSAMDVSGTSHTVGGPNPGDGNVLAGAGFYQGLALGGSGHVVYGNFIGTDITGTLDLGSDRVGISAFGTDITIGGTQAGQGNTVAFNGAVFGSGGVSVSGQRVRIRGNRIYGNHPTTGANGLGIDLSTGGNDGVTPNDPGDGDAGPNDHQNFPLLTSAGPTLGEGSGTHIVGLLNSEPSLTYDIDFYSNPPCASRPQEYVEGQDYIGSTQVTTDGSGNASIDVTLPFTVEAGARITATATDPNGNTSEFSQRLIFSMNPASGPPAGGTSVTINGMLFEDGATVSIGGQPATNVNVTGPTQITATTPALAAGSLNNVVVTNTNGTGGTLVNGWVADFSDVPNSQQFYFHITKLVANAITVGCGTGIYCPLNSVTRQQMAVFILKSKNGLCYVPPPCSGDFPDVPCSSVFAPWIEALADAGITGGCGGGNYCPTNPVTRQQMAVFLLKTKHGSSYVPPDCDGDFDDVDCPGNPFADWIEQLATEGITGGCGGLNYCPTQSVRRDQMAAFLYNIFQF
jgi:IPT/TIG domain/S-layer homology domain